VTNNILTLNASLADDVDIDDTSMNNTTEDIPQLFVQQENQEHREVKAKSKKRQNISEEKPRKKKGTNLTKLKGTKFYTYCNPTTSLYITQFNSIFIVEDHNKHT